MKADRLPVPARRRPRRQAPPKPTPTPVKQLPPAAIPKVTTARERKRAARYAHLTPEDAKLIQALVLKERLTFTALASVTLVVVASLVAWSVRPVAASGHVTATPEPRSHISAISAAPMCLDTSCRSSVTPHVVLQGHSIPAPALSAGRAQIPGVGDVSLRKVSERHVEVTVNLQNRSWWPIFIQARVTRTSDPESPLKAIGVAHLAPGQREAAIRVELPKEGNMHLAINFPEGT